MSSTHTKASASEYVSLKHLAKRLGMDRSHVKRYVTRHGVRVFKIRTHDSQNQLTLAVTSDDAELIVKRRQDDGFTASSKPVVKEVGVFYVVRLIPELDPRRIKLGLADDIASRIAQHRTSAPTAQVVKSWPCKRSWEGTVMDALSAVGCKLILNEVFECNDVELLIERGESVFRLLPDPNAKVELSEASPHNTYLAAGRGDA